MIYIYERDDDKTNDKRIIYKRFKGKTVFKINEQRKDSSQHFNKGIPKRDTFLTLAALSF